MPADQGCLPQSRFPGGNDSRDAPPIGVFSVLVLPIAVLPIVGVWVVILYGTPAKLADASPELFFRLGSVVEFPTSV